MRDLPFMGPAREEWENWLCGHEAIPGDPDCDSPVLTPVTDPGDRSGRVFCSDGCLTSAAESSYEQRYQPGAAT